MLAGGLCFFASCTGDRTPQSGNDTVKNTFKIIKDTSDIDTDVTSSSDNSASGGANLVKDTAKSR